MALSKGGIITAGLLSTGGIGGSVALGYHLSNKETFRDKLAGTLLTDSQEDTTKWTARVALLSKDVSTTLTQALKTIKGTTGNDKVQKVKAWCNQNLDSYVSDNKQLLKDLQKYCAYNIKDKLTNPIDTGSWDANTHDKKLKDAEDNNLSSKMKNIKDQLKDSQNRYPNVLKNWCNTLENLVFKGKDDSNFKDAQEYCATK